MGRRRRTQDEDEDEDEDEERPSSSRRRNPCKKKENLQFFIIIHPAIIQDQKLGLPSKFVRKVGDHLSDVAVLKVPNDQFWKVELKKSDKNIWFHNGWQEFVEYHSIRAGHFLVFKFIGNSRFNVLIFDMSGTEIQYPCDAHNVEDSNNGGECPMHHENKETKENDDDSVVFLEESVGMRLVKRRLCSTYMGSSPSKKCEERRESKAPREQKAVQAVEAFKSKNPFFIRVMCSAYVRHRFTWVSRIFAQRYLSENTIGSLILTVMDGRTWPVKYITRRNNSYTSLSKGWGTFVEDNGLEEGNVCVFELIDRENLLLKVSIFRDAQISYGSKIKNVQGLSDARQCSTPEEKEIKMKSPDGLEPCTNQEESGGMLTANRRLSSASERSNPSKKRKQHRASGTAQALQI